MATMNVTLNYLGVPVTADYMARLRDGADHSGEVEYRMILHVLEVPPEVLSDDILERYVEVSSGETYTPIFPHTDRLFERLLAPLKSAKRCYCFGEYIAAIELSAHIGEMLSLLIWQMTPTKLNAKPMDASVEKSLFGRDFERLGQDRRIDVLKATGAISATDAEMLDFLRATRRGHFHLWDAPPNARSDALQCFLKVSTLVQNALQIEYDHGALKMNPLLLAYIERHSQPSGSVSNL